MPCIPFTIGNARGIMCMPAMLEVEYKGRTYLFENNAYCGLLSCKKDGDIAQRNHPKGAWELARKLVEKAE